MLKDRTLTWRETLKHKTFLKEIPSVCGFFCCASRCALTRVKLYLSAFTHSSAALSTNQRSAWLSYPTSEKNSTFHSKLSISQQTTSYTHTPVGFPSYMGTFYRQCFNTVPQLYPITRNLSAFYLSQKQKIYELFFFTERKMSPQISPTFF